jgi:hypothetical protein
VPAAASASPVGARSAARAPERRRAVNGEARRRAQRRNDPVWQIMLTCPCPHGGTLGDCPKAWCAGRRADWAEHDYQPPELAPAL